MTKKIIYFLLVCSVVVISCKKDGSVDVAARPVIISYLLAGHPINVKVYKQREFSDTAVYGALIGGLKLQVSNGTQTVSLTENTTGNYTYADSSFLQAGKTYTLQFNYNNTVVSASTLMPVQVVGYNASKTNIKIPVSPTVAQMQATAIRFAWKNPDSLYHVLVLKNDEANVYKFNGFYPSNFTVNVKKTEAYDVTNSRFRYTGKYSAILFTINKEYSDILTSNTNTSSQELTNPPGNIINGYGIFTGMQADTIRLTVL